MSRKRARAGPELETVHYGDEIVGVFPRAILVKRGRSVIAISLEIITEKTVISMNCEDFPVLAYADTDSAPIALIYGSGHLTAFYAWGGAQIEQIPFEGGVIGAAIRSDGFIAALLTDALFVKQLKGGEGQILPIPNAEAVGFSGPTTLVAAGGHFNVVNLDLSFTSILEYTGQASYIGGINGHAVLCTSEEVVIFNLVERVMRRFAVPGSRCAAFADDLSVWVLHGLDGLTHIVGKCIETTQLPIPGDVSMLPLIATYHNQIQTSPGQSRALHLIQT